MGRSRVRRLRAVQGKYNDDDADSNESYGRMRASECACFEAGIVGTWGFGGVIARARPFHLLRDRFARSLRGLLLTRSLHKASAIGVRMDVRNLMNGWKWHGGARYLLL